MYCRYMSVCFFLAILFILFIRYNVLLECIAGYMSVCFFLAIYLFCSSGTMYCLNVLQVYECVFFSDWIQSIRRHHRKKEVIIKDISKDAFVLDCFLKLNYCAEVDILWVPCSSWCARWSECRQTFWPLLTVLIGTWQVQVTKSSGDNSV